MRRKWLALASFPFPTLHTHLTPTPWEEGKNEWAAYCEINLVIFLQMRMSSADSLHLFNSSIYHQSMDMIPFFKNKTNQPPRNFEIRTLTSVPPRSY